MRWATALAIVGVLLTVTTVATRAFRATREARAAREASHGLAELQAGRADRAVAALREAVALEPEHAPHRVALGEALIELGRLDEAITYLQGVLRADPVAGRPNLIVARAHRAAGRAADAERYYYRAVYGRWPSADDPERLQARLELIALFEEEENRERVRSELTQLAAAFPGDATLQVHAGQSLLEMGFPADAARVFEAMTTRFRDPGAAWTGLARARLATGDHAGALSAATRALAIDASDSPAVGVRKQASAVLALDPTLPRLSTRERQARWQRFASMVRDRLAACASQPLSGDAERLVALGETLLKRRAPADATMSAAVAMARAVQRECGEAGFGDSTLAAVAARAGAQEGGR